MSFVTVTEAARELRVSRPTVYKLIRLGKLKAARFGECVRIGAGDLRNFIESSQTAPAAASATCPRP